MTIYSVNTVYALETTLGKARDGDIIKLAPGDYSGLYVRDLHIDGAVTITSQDPSNQAVLTDLVIRDSNGITLKGLELGAQESGQQYAFQITQSTNISLNNLKIYGPDNMGTGLEASLMLIRSSKNVHVTESEIFRGWHGIGLRDNEEVTIEGNYFHDLRTDGVRGGGNSDLRIAQNLFTDFYPQANDHPDAIQLWTTNTEHTSRNIEITENLILRGNGTPLQGIFIRDTFNDMPFENLTVTGNFVAGGRYNGITVSGANDVYVADNVVSGYTDQRSWIRLQYVTDLTAKDNQASTYVTPDRTIEGQQGNTLIPSVAPDDTTYLEAWLSTHGDFSGVWGAGGEELVALLQLGVEVEPAHRDNQSHIDKSELYLIEGTSKNDKLGVDSLRDSRVEGRAGDDRLESSVNGQHELAGGTGDDIYILTADNSVIIESADEGYDMVRTSVDHQLADNVEVLRIEESGLVGRGNGLDNRIIGSDGVDTLYGEGGDDTIQGNSGNDIISGGTGNDRLRGDSGDDKLLGNHGHDRLFGGYGDDIIDAGAGNDFIEGGRGEDVMTGGAGGDRFLFRAEDVVDGSIDRITDFMPGTDRISLSHIDAKEATRVDNSFDFIGKSEFHNRPGELRYEVVAGNAYVQIDTNGDGKADMTVIVEGVNKLTSDDFVL